MFWKPLDEKTVQCLLCPQECRIVKGKKGGCGVRKNIDGTLYSLNYGRIVSVAVDSVEKKPLFHFYPGSDILSIATVGCNFHCRFCQNWDISQPDAIIGEEMTPEDIVDIALNKGIKIIAYTYTEPTIFFEFAYETARLAHEKGIKNVFVTNGYINPEPLKKIAPYLDAMNIDIKSLEDVFYQKLCGVKGVAPVLETIKTAAKSAHVELTNLVIPTLNDKEENFVKLRDWIFENLGAEVPLHFSRYFPCYKMRIPPTPLKTLERAREIVVQKLKYVYLGNVRLLMKK